MRKENESSFTSVVSVNPYTYEYIHGISGFLSPTTTAEYAKDQLLVSYLNTKGYINNQIEISKNIPDEDILDAINIKVYDELGLDQAIEYQIQYVETFHNIENDNRHFQVFIADPLEILQTYQSVIDKIKYIDVITPTPLLLKSLYSKEIIDYNGIHCFIYFEENDAFLCIYNEKEFVYTKSLKYSLLEMHERFCELYGERIEYIDFIHFLTNENLKYTQSTYKEFILKLYKEMFANINDILTYTKKAFDIEKVEHIYIGLQIDAASKLYEIAEVELSIPASDFNFDYGFNDTENYIDQMHALMHISTTLEEDEKYACNFSSFHRPPKFTQRDSGKLIMLIAASIFVAFSYPIAYWVLTYSQDLQYELLKQTYQEVHAEKSTRQASIKSREADQTKALALLKEEQENYGSKKNTLIKIHDVKVNYPMKAKLITQLTSDLNKYAVKLEKITYSEADKSKNLTFHLVSSKDKKITQLLEYLTKKHEHVFQFSLESILYDETKKVYFSDLKVKIL